MLYNGRSVTCAIGYLLTLLDALSLNHGNKEVTSFSGTVGKLYVLCSCRNNMFFDGSIRKACGLIICFSI